MTKPDAKAAPASLDIHEIYFRDGSMRKFHTKEETKVITKEGTLFDTIEGERVWIPNQSILYSVLRLGEGK